MYGKYKLFDSKTGKRDIFFLIIDFQGYFGYKYYYSSVQII